MSRFKLFVTPCFVQYSTTDAEMSTFMSSSEQRDRHQQQFDGV